MNEKGIKIPEENSPEPTVLLGALLFGTNYLKLQHRMMNPLMLPLVTEFKLRKELRIMY